VRFGQVKRPFGQGKVINQAITCSWPLLLSKNEPMRKIKPRALFAGMATIALCLLLISFAPRPGGYSYTLHLNNKLVSEHYVTSKFETPSLTLTDQTMKGTLGIYFNECGQIGQARKLSLRTADEKILKEWSFDNSTMKHDPMEISLKDVTTTIAPGKWAVYYTSERVTKPQMLVYLVTTTRVSKGKVASR
jgi:hypothetical protein